MPVTFEMTNWNDTTFGISNWTNAYPVLDPVLEQAIEEEAYNETVAAASASTGYTFTERHVAMSVVPHFTGLLSLIGSAWIVWDIMKKPKRSRGVYERLLMGLAISDMIASLGMALSTWPVPEYQAQKTWGAVGNIHSCEFQGFLIQLGLATPLYSAALAVYYVLLVKFNYRPDSIQMLRFEKFSHIFANSLAALTAVISLAMKQYNNANIWCWIAPYPYGCEDKGTCERGNHATVLRMAFYFSWLWMSFIVVTVSMILLAYTVIAQTNKMDRYRQKGQKRSKVQTDRIRNVVIQSSLYIFAFMVTAVPLSVARIYQAKYSCSSTFFPLSITTVTVFPMQGFWNAIIYFRTRFTKHMAEQQIGKRMSAMISTRLSVTNSSFFRQGSSRSLGSNGSGSFFFGGGSKAEGTTGLFGVFGRTSTQATSQATSEAKSSQNEISLAQLALEMSDSEDDEDDEDGGRRKSWSIMDLQAKVAKMNDVEADDDYEDEDAKDTPLAGETSEKGQQQHQAILPDSSSKSHSQSEELMEYQAYLAAQAAQSEEFDDEGDVEMEGSQRLLDRDAFQRQHDTSHRSRDTEARSMGSSSQSAASAASSGMGISRRSNVSDHSRRSSMRDTSGRSHS